MSASLTWELGGIGIWPQVPTPPSFTFFASYASAVLSPRYLAATSLYEGPTTFLSTAWQARQPLFCARAVSSAAWAAGAAASTRAMAARQRGVFMAGSWKGDLGRWKARFWAKTGFRA